MPVFAIVEELIQALVEEYGDRIRQVFRAINGDIDGYVEVSEHFRKMHETFQDTHLLFDYESS